MKVQKLSNHPYGSNHPYIGKPCLWRGIPCIPYGSYVLEKSCHITNPGVRLVLLMFERDGVGGSAGLHAMSGVEPNDKDLIVLDFDSAQGKKILHTVLAAAADLSKQVSKAA